ncbi:hypothetical protein O181_033730 [Austropuccinia psidii MF-1]|uniref:RNA-binding S4 domain-containing protein n=1 Tax=Austropuccinia psidii MF-1 TaxID=1389203 RepID=A0A9Q3D3K4_9BASI|nr:hypothetical protein [Austropuccinia psidii MF-1]
MKNPYNIKKSLPRMSWHPQNLFNLYQRTYGPESKETNFSRSSKSVFWQRWKSKAVTRGYHGDWIQEKKFKRHYLPTSLPHLSKSSNLQLPYSAGHAKVPLAALMYQEIERRLDVAIFRSCFADSIYEARRMVVHGAVKLNGVRCKAAWTRLHPGDIFTVNPISIPMLNPGKTWPTNFGEPYIVDEKLQNPKKSPKLQSPISNESNALEEAPKTKTESPPDADQSQPINSNPVTPEADEEEPPNPPSETTNIISPSPHSPNLRFTLPPYASPFLFVPPYLEVSYRLCSSVYLRHPTAGPGYCEIPTPWDADGEVMRLAWEWYTRQGLGRRMRRERKEWDSIRDLKRNPFAEGHLRKHSIGGRVAVHGQYEGGRVGMARQGSGEPRLFPQP